MSLQSNIHMQPTNPFELNTDEATRQLGSTFFMIRTPQIIQSSPFQPGRGRFSSFNSTFLSPLQLNRSPELSCSQMNDIDNIVDLQLDKQEEPQPIQMNHEDDCSSDSRGASESGDQPAGLFDIKSIIETVVNNVSINEHQIQKRRNQLKEAGEVKLLEVFDMLVRRLKKVKKTKQQMVKYCMRKVFRYIGSKGKRSNGRDVSQALREYFGNDRGFDVPFKRNSSDKTMNAAFLTKVFSCPVFVADYRTYIRNLHQEAQKDNNKKIRALAKSIQKLGNIGTPKQLESLRRLPWTMLIINKVVELSQSLLAYAGDENQPKQSPERRSVTPNFLHQPYQKLQQVYVAKKMSVIILTPPVGPMETLVKLEDFPRLDES